METIDLHILDLPAEILTAFFLACVPTPTRDNPGPQLSRRHPAVILSHVCREWRELALSTPLLWSRMFISTPSEQASPRNVTIEGWGPKLDVLGRTIKAWFGRSAQCPLTIFLNLRCASFCIDDEARSRDVYSRLTAEIFRCPKRWRYVDINIATHWVPARPFLMAAMNLTVGHFPILASLEIRFAPGGDYHSQMMYHSQAIDALSGRLMQTSLFSGPSLRRVGLEGQWDIKCSLGERLKSWAPLEELDINLSPACKTHSRFDPYPDFEPCHALQILEALPSLVKASFTFHSGGPGKQAKDAAPIHLPNLQSLSLRGIPMGPEFASSVVLPSLAELHLMFDPYRSPDYDPDRRALPSPDEYEDGILELLRVFGDQLAALTLNPQVLSPSSLLSCLDFLNNDRLESLRLIPKKPLTTPGPRCKTHEDANRGVVDYEALVRLAKPGAFPNLRHIEMNVWNRRGEECELAVLDFIVTQRRNIVDQSDSSTTAGRIATALDVSKGKMRHHATDIHSDEECQG